MSTRPIPVSQRGLLLLIAVALLASGVAISLGRRPPAAGIRSEPIVLRDVTIILPMFREPRPIDVNVASAEELDALPGIGPALAARILAYRDAHGPFACLDDLALVDGIGTRTVEGLRDRATAGAESRPGTTQ